MDTTSGGKELFVDTGLNEERLKLPIIGMVVGTL